MSGRNSAYSPLPQSNSDSEISSEELHADEEPTIINRISKSQNKAFEKVFNGQNPNSMNYKLLDADKDVEATFVKFQPTSNNISAFKPNDKTEVFSASRKICFILSLLLCVFTTVTFIWFLPCNEKACFFAPTKNKTVFWEHIFEGLEIFGPISLFFNAYDKSQNLVFFTKNIFVDVKNKSEKQYDLMALKGESGVEKWKFTLNKEPRDLDCNMIDLTSDGVKDCLIMGDNFFKAIDSVSGTEIWDFYNFKTKETVPHVIDFPTVIFDVNGDGINDLITSCSFYQLEQLEYSNTNSQNYIIILSGKTGEIINTPKEIKICLSIHNVTIESNFIFFTCHNPHRKEYQETLSLSALLKTLKNHLNQNVVLSKWDNTYEHPKESNTINVNGYKVIVDNQGLCPNSCQVAVDIKDEKNKNSSINNTVYTYNDKNSYCILPMIFKNESLKTIVLKFWKWELDKSFDVGNKNGVLKRAVNFKSVKRNKLKRSDNLYQEMLTENESDLKRHKRGTNSGLIGDMHYINNTGLYDGVYVHVVNEMIVSIIFNKSHPFVKNITQSKILQICKFEKCEPDFQHQKQSLLVADVNGDGREELISFSSRFKHQDGKGELQKNIQNWRLESVIKVATL